MTGRGRWLEAGLLVAILLLAALTRLPGLDERGRWDADQGHDMLVLRAMAVDGEIPLLGPKTSIGTFHHGAIYYYLLAPAAIASAADPVAVTGEIALFGIAAVAATWWLARLIGGPLAAVAAGLFAALSPAGIDESTFIWNPNLIPVAAALAFAGAIMARRTGRARWWLLAGIGAAVTMQCHVLGVVIVVPLAWAWGADLVRRHRAGQATTGVLRGGLGAVLLIAASYVPLAAYELQNGFAESRAILGYAAGGGREAAGGVAERVVTVGLRAITWPFTGLITERIWVSLVTAIIVTLVGTIAILGRRRIGGPPAPVTEPPARDAAPVDVAAGRWLVGALAFSVVALAVFAPSLAVVVPDLPNDHYHAFLDPIVLALTGVGLARLATGLASPARPTGDGPAVGGAGRAGGVLVAGRLVAGRLTALGLATVLVVIEVTAWPPAVAADGGWPLADEAAARVLEVTGGDTFLLDGIPSFKSADALRFPLERRGAKVLPAGVTAETPMAVLVCDPLFDDVVGAPCGGPAEDAWLADDPYRGTFVLRSRFEAGSRRVISVYAAYLP